MAVVALLDRPPDTATAEDLRNFQVRQHECGANPGTINSTVSALRFFYTVTLRRRDLARGLVAARRPHTVREVLCVEEAARLLEAAPGIKNKAAFGVAYGAGLRVLEVAHLRVDNIDSQRMLLRVENGKGGRDRNAMLSPQLLELLQLSATRPQIPRESSPSRSPCRRKASSSRRRADRPATSP